VLAQIEQEIAQIKQAIAEHEAKAAIAYQHYINALSLAVGKYLLNAVFWLCTHEYPQAFLALPLSDKQKLQTAIQQLAKSCQAKLKEELQQLPTAQLLRSEPLDQLLQKLLDQTSQSANQLLQAQGIIPSVQESEAEQQITKIRLRPAEVEYMDRTVMQYRSEIRVISARCQHLIAQLEKKYQAKTIAEAELAWRSLFVADTD
jgi:hypothetical protein